MAEESGIGKRRSAAKEEATLAYQTRKKEIAEAAVRVFNRDGFKGASISRVAAELKIDRASLYYYIASKEELFDEILREVIERNVSIEAVRSFKLVTHAEVDAITDVICGLQPTLSRTDAVDVIAATTSMSGAFWQMATPGPEIAALYRSDPRLSHAVMDVEARVRRLTAAILRGLLAKA